MGAPFTSAVTVAPLGCAQFVPIARTANGSPTDTRKPGRGASSRSCGVCEHLTALAAFSRPPVTDLPARAAIGSTVPKSSALRPAPVAAGSAALTSAATPETCGVAIDVPSNQSYWLPGMVE